tara:strand:- start:329 stop:838 length:510 start_codon:yes stop_codon:yes gene_type:complete
MAKASRDKGARFERAICQDLRSWLGPDWSVERVPAYRQGKGQLGMGGDIACTSQVMKMPFCFELKHYAKFSADNILKPGCKMLQGFWWQARCQADAIQKAPLLLVKRDRAATFALMPLAVLRQINWQWAVEARVQVRVGNKVERVAVVRWDEMRKIDPSCLFGVHNAWC